MECYGIKGQILNWLRDFLTSRNQGENSISRKIKAVKDDKAEGPDGITPKLLRLAEPAVVPSLTKLYALSAKEGEVFSLWKKAHLCQVFKKDDPTDTSNYRPISLLSVPILESSVSDKFCNMLWIMVC